MSQTVTIQEPRTNVPGFLFQCRDVLRAKGRSATRVYDFLYGKDCQDLPGVGGRLM